MFVSVGASRPPRKTDGSLSSSSLPCPIPERLPVMLLIREPHFNKLFLLLEQLSKLQFTIPTMASEILTPHSVQEYIVKMQVLFYECIKNLYEILKFNSSRRKVACNV